MITIVIVRSNQRGPVDFDAQEKRSELRTGSLVTFDARRVKWADGCLR
jgi:hypothetical protein